MTDIVCIHEFDVLVVPMGCNFRMCRRCARVEALQHFSPAGRVWNPPRWCRVSDDVANDVRKRTAEARAMLGETRREDRKR